MEDQKGKVGPPKVSVIIHFRNSRGSLQKTLDALSKQQYPEDLRQVIVVDDCSSTGIDDLQRTYAFTCLRNEGPDGLNRSFNIGLKESSGDIIIFLQSDCVPFCRDWISRIVQDFDDPSVGAVSCYFFVDDDEIPVPSRYFTYIYIAGWHHRSREIPDELPSGTAEAFLTGTNCHAYRREILLGMGGLDESFGPGPKSAGAGDEYDLTAKLRSLGKRIILDYEARVVHDYSKQSHHSNTVTSHMKKAVQNAGGEKTVFSKYRRFISPRIILSSFLLLWTIPILGLMGFLASSPILLGVEYVLFVATVGFYVMRGIPEIWVRTADLDLRNRRRNSLYLVTYSGASIIMSCLMLLGGVPLGVVLALAPSTFGASMLFLSGLVRALRYYRQFRDPMGSVMVLSFSIVWNLLYGLSATGQLLRLFKHRSFF
jgi:glycosyltransferase involved in cell wall biosynthesis